MKENLALIVGATVLLSVMLYFLDKDEQRKFELKKLNCVTEAEK